MKTMTDLGHFPSRETERAGTAQLGEEEIRGDLISVHENLRGGSDEKGGRLFSMKSGSRMQ